MEEERIEEILKTQAEAPVVEERHRTPMTILFSDIKDSTAYFERNGDVKGLAMVERHNKLLFPCVENNHGRIIKTIGDAIMALFNDPVDAVTAAVGCRPSWLRTTKGVKIPKRSTSKLVSIRVWD